MAVKVLPEDDFEPDSGCYIKVVKAGPVTDVTILEKWPSVSPVIKVGKCKYVDVRTGEIILAKAGINRSGDLQSIKKTLARIRRLINANVVPANSRWVTLTYAENMTDSRRLMTDFDSFRKRLYRFCEKQGYGRPEYLSVVEPQGRGAWHIHAFFIWNNAAPFLANADLAKLWGHGFVKITSVADVDNIGAYFSAYLADIPVSDFAGDGPKEVKLDASDGKKYIKGGRLHLYPVGMRIVRHSKGIKEPEVKIISGIREFEKEKASLGGLTFHKTYKVASEDKTKVINRMIKESYNKNRKDST